MTDLTACRFTDIEAAVEEGHFIQHHLDKTALLVCNKRRDLFVLTEEDYRSAQSKFQVLEIFHRGGCYEHKGLLAKYT